MRERGNRGLVSLTRGTYAGNREWAQREEGERERERTRERKRERMRVKE